MHACMHAAHVLPPPPGCPRCQEPCLRAARHELGQTRPGPNRLQRCPRTVKAVDAKKPWYCMSVAAYVSCTAVPSDTARSAFSRCRMASMNSMALHDQQASRQALLPINGVNLPCAD